MEGENELSRIETELRKKGKELFKIVHALVEDLPKTPETEYAASFMLEDVTKINAKLAGASGDQLYAIKMQNAAIIRQAALDLYVSKHHFTPFAYKNTEYFDLLRSSIDEFRELFIDWVAAFDVWNYVKDDWGLFNPPGVNARDKDPDDDIPFDNPLDTGDD
jgi:hypothetical protein